MSPFLLRYQFLYWLPAILYLGAGLASGLTGGDMGRTWLFFGVPYGAAPFWDLSMLTEAFDCRNAGLAPDIYNTDCLTSKNLVYNYPRVWLLFSHLGTSARHNVVYGVALGVALLGTVLAVLRPATRLHALLAAAATVSPAVLLLVERGNSDALILLLVVAGAILGSHGSPRVRLAGVVVLFSSGVLKLFPIVVLLPMVWLDRSRTVRRASVVALGLFLGYCVMIRHELVLIKRNTPIAVDLAYGVRVPFLAVTEALDAEDKPLETQVATSRAFVQAMRTIFADRVWWTSPEGSEVLQYGGAALLVGLVGLGSWRLRRQYQEQYRFAGGADFSTIAFRSGAMIYLFTYCAGISWNYRLSFLLLCLPKLFAIHSENERAGNAVAARLARAATALVVMSMWASRNSFYANLGFDEFLHFTAACVLGMHVWNDFREGASFSGFRSAWKW
ncbi:MAG: hypothetical protein ACK5UT_09415 [Acidobacteriota bacterium]|jgi:hypothetical protein